MDQTCDILIIEDNATSLAILRGILERAGYTCIVAVDGCEGWNQIIERQPRVVVCDWNLPGMDGLEICRKLRETPEVADTFFVMITGRDNEADRVHSLEQGADDYFTKPIDRSTLLARVRVGMRISGSKEELRRAAITDGMTGLFNHDYLNDVIEKELKRSRRYGHRLSLIMLDLDFFKAVNDTYGHLAGNDTLIEASRILREAMRDFDTVGRYGGEEFLIIAPETSLDDAVAIAERIRLGIADTLHVEALRGHVVTASLGVASAEDIRVRSAAGLVDLADRALYKAKHSGRNRVCSAREVVEEDGAIQVENKEVESLRKRVAVLSVQAKDVYMQSISSLLQALEEKDAYTARHSENVAAYCHMIATHLGLSVPLVSTIRNAGLLHDVGKVGIPDRVLLKPSRLTFTEQNVISQVPSISVRILDHLRILESEMHIIRHQREYFDGTGYPDQLAAEQIPIGSRILLAANALDAMTTDRVYRPCRSLAIAIAEMRELSGVQFDPKIVDCVGQLVHEQQSEIEERIRTTSESLNLSACVL